MKELWVYFFVENSSDIGNKPAFPQKNGKKNHNYIILKVYLGLTGLPRYLLSSRTFLRNSFVLEVCKILFFFCRFFHPKEQISWFHFVRIHCKELWIQTRKKRILFSNFDWFPKNDAYYFFPPKKKNLPLFGKISYAEMRINSDFFSIWPKLVVILVFGKNTVVQLMFIKWLSYYMDVMSLSVLCLAIPTLCLIFGTGCYMFNTS